MVPEMRNETGISPAAAGASADPCEPATRPYAAGFHGTMSRYLHSLRRRWRWVPDAEIRHFSVRYEVRYDAPGPWILSGARCEGCVHFHDLAAALSFARDDSGAGEADIELHVDGFYIFVHQSRGWPHRLCAPATSARR
jgi:hypothetical protein